MDLQSQEPLKFDEHAATTLKAKLSAIARQLRSATVGSQVCQHTTEKAFKGYFANLLTSNMSVADTDRLRVASAFDDAARGLQDIITAAQAELSPA